MNDETLRLWIIASIRRILAGQEFTAADWEARPTVGWEEVAPNRGVVHSDQHPAFFGLKALGWWADDADIRARDPRYADMRKQELRVYLDGMDRDA